MDLDPRNWGIGKIIIVALMIVLAWQGAQYMALYGGVPNMMEYPDIGPGHGHANGFNIADPTVAGVASYGASGYLSGGLNGRVKGGNKGVYTIPAGDSGQGYFWETGFYNFDTGSDVNIGNFGRDTANYKFCGSHRVITGEYGGVYFDNVEYWYTSQVGPNCEAYKPSGGSYWADYNWFKGKIYYDAGVPPTLPPPPPPPPSKGLLAVLGWIWAGILMVFEKLPFLTISGAAQATLGSTQAYQISLEVPPADSSCGDGFCEYHYGIWGLVDKDKKILEEGSAEQILNGTYSKSISIVIPSSPGNYVIVSAITEINMTYANGAWNQGTEHVIASEAYGLSAPAPIIITPPVSRGLFGVLGAFLWGLVQKIFAWI